MIAVLRGKILSRKNSELIFDVNGVGYQLLVSKKAFETCSSFEAEYSLHTYLDVKETSLILYGFADEREKEMFKMLISVNGIGPKMAHTVLANAYFEDILNLIGGMSKFNIKIPGLGSKKLDLISMSLKDKIFKLEAGIEPSENSSMPLTGADNTRYEAMTALLNLGYGRSDAEKIIREILKESSNTNLNTEELIRKSLEYITGKK